MTDTVNDTVKAAIQAQIVATLNAVPEAINELVKAALSQRVERATGKADGYSSDRVPYLDYIVGETIRRAAYEGVREAVEARKDEIKDAIKRQISSDNIVDAMADRLIGIMGETWRIDISFRDEKNR